MTPESAPDRLLWLDGASGVVSRDAVGLNGSTQFLEAASNASLQSGNVDWAWAGWVLLNSKTGTRAIAAKERNDGVGTHEREFRIFYTNTTDRIRMFVSSGAGSTNRAAFNAEEFGPTPLGEWFFVLGWYDSANIRAGLVVNGSTPTTVNLSGGPPGTNNRPFLLGVADQSTHLDGRLDEVCWFKTPPGGIASVIGDLQAFLYNGGAGRHYSELSAAQKAAFGLVSWWPMGEGSGLGADVHGSNTLTVIGSPSSVDGKVERPATNLGLVRSWTGKQGNLLIQNSMNQRPTWRSNGRMVFDGVNDQLSRSSPIVGNRAAFTVFVKVRLDGLPVTNPAVIFTEADGPGDVINRLSISPTGHVVASYRPSGGAIGHATSATPLVVGDESVVAVRRDGTSLQVFVDGLPSGPAAMIDTGASLTGATMSIGGPAESTGLSYLNGQISSVFASGQALTDAQVASLSGNL